MLTIYDLNGFADELGDLDRDADPLELTVEATKLIKNNRAQVFLSQRRAAAAADAHYLGGVSMRKIAKANGMTTQTVRNWLTEYGPTGYLTVGEEPDGASHGRTRLVLRVVAMDPDDDAMKRKLRALVVDGRRIVPARRNLLDPTQPDGYAAGVDAEALWNELAP